MIGSKESWPSFLGVLEESSSLSSLFVAAVDVVDPVNKDWVIVVEIFVSAWDRFALAGA